ncbi:MAG: hypothetical protein LBL31_05675 [Spirochaetaceae bacterium]|jgi:hypothetical protein|nr:hypothetical protein [Spirochaetaceae bacterium]
MANRYHAGFAAVLFFCGTALAAQELADGGAAPFFFPVHRLWQDARGGALRWQPDWPLEMPPDSFEPVATGRARRVTVAVTAAVDGPPPTENAEIAAGAGLESSGLSPDSGPDAERAENAALPAEYTAQLDSDGRFTAFPFLLNGVFRQAFARYDRGGKMEAMTLAVSPEESVEVVFLETDEQGDGRIGGPAAADRPVVARVKTAAAYYFVTFRWETGGCVELWTDEAGTPLGILRDERVLHYDSMGNSTFMGDSASSVSARYNAAGARYWSRAQNELFFQRDEAGLIVRLTDVQGSAPDAAGPPVNYSYDYQFDQNGAWTERREVRWAETQGYLVPAPGTLVTRVIDYAPLPDR